MAGICRSAVLAGTKSLASRSKTLIPKTLSSKTLASPFSSSTRPIPCASRYTLFIIIIYFVFFFSKILFYFILFFFRILSALVSVESLMPLHSAVASARLKSFIAVDSTTWSWLSQGVFLLLFKFCFLSFQRC